MLTISIRGEEHIDAEQPGRAQVTGKGNKTRFVYFQEPTKMALAQYITSTGRKRPDEFVFLSQRGGPLSVSGILQMIKRVSARAGLEDRRVYTHLIRHTFGTYYVKQGGDALTLQELLGHSSLATTRIYVHMGNQDLKEAHGKFSPVGRMVEMGMMQ